MSNSDIRYLTPINIEIKKDKYCRFKKSGIKYIDYKDPDCRLKFVHEQGKILPRRLTGCRRKVSWCGDQARPIRARHIFS